jgi:hypothetical protein
MVPAASGPDKRARLAQLSLEVIRAILQPRFCGLSTPLPAVADPRVFVPEVVYCGGAAHDVETPR